MTTKSISLLFFTLVFFGTQAQTLSNPKQLQTIPLQPGALRSQSFPVPAKQGAAAQKQSGGYTHVETVPDDPLRQKYTRWQMV